MFAVPGWDISAKSLAQEKPSRLGSSLQPDAGTESSKSKKRKRPHNDIESSRKIGGEELEKLWNQRFGRKTTEQARGKDKAKSKLKPEQNGIRHDTPPGPLSRSPPQDRRKDVFTGSNPKKQKKDLLAEVMPEKQKKLKKEKRKNREQQPADPNHYVDTNGSSSHLLPPQPPPAPTASSNLTPLQLKMRNKLTSARFRHLNQTLYTTPSSTALSLFASTPSLFSEYHAGFTQQVHSSWPTNPIDTFISSIRTRGALPHPTNPTTPLPRRKTQSCTIADLGCGDAPFARSLQPLCKRLHLKIHSYDLFSPNHHVKVADIANLPLRDGEADIAIFCLSLMGTNWVDFIEEAWRILRGDGKGELWVAEVKSRFGRKKDGVVEHSVGKQRKKAKSRKKNAREEDDEMVGEELFASSVNEKAETEDDTTNIAPFVDVLQRRGFKLQESSVDKSNKMFVSMIFHKADVPVAGKYKGWKWNGKEYAKQHDSKMRFVGGDEEEVGKEEEGKVLKPCVYKSR